MKKLITVLCIIILTISCFANYAYADNITESMKNTWNQQNGSTDTMKAMAGKVLYIVQLVGYAVLLVYCSILGMKYMYSSTDDKAKIKEKLMPYVIGAIILFGTSTAIGLINKFVGEI